MRQASDTAMGTRGGKTDHMRKDAQKQITKTACPDPAKKNRAGSKKASYAKEALPHRLKMVRLLLAAACLLAAAAGIGTFFSLRYRQAHPAVLRYADRLEMPVPGGLAANIQSALSVPTQITRIGDDYFIVDCYHDQILTSPELDRPLTEWTVMSDQISRGHTIAGDGTVYLADDTENHRILVFEKKDGIFYLTQTFDGIGVRPHYVVYDEASKRFYALSSMTGELYVFVRPADTSDVALEKVLSIPELNGFYVRSFTIEGDDIYFVSGNSTIIRAGLKDLSVRETWPVPAEIAGMVQLTRIQDYFYITVSTDLTGSQDYATLIRTKDLGALAEGNWEDIYGTFIGGGTPYYISSFDGHYFLTEHRIPGHGVWQFDVRDNEIVNVETLFPG